MMRALSSASCTNARLVLEQRAPANARFVELASGHGVVALFEINTKIESYVKIVSLKSETMGELMNRIPGSRFFCFKFTRLGLF